MATISRPNGIRIDLPDTYQIMTTQSARGPRATAGTRPMGPIPLRPGTEEFQPIAEELTRALSTLNMEVVDTIPLVPTQEASTPDGIRRAAVNVVPEQQLLQLEIDLGSDESAVLLLEQDGMYSWCFGDMTEPPQRQEIQRRGAPLPARRQVRFTVEVQGSRLPEASRDKRRFIKTIIYRAVRAIVFKFVSKLVLGQVVKRLEKDVEPGLILISHANPTKWQKLADPQKLSLPADRPARILLFIHGTFSSTVGGFGPIGLTSHGSEFLTTVFGAYDAVIGFDHRTLSEDPLENAQELLALLKQLKSKFPVHFDTICHSRGGLVYRSLIEYLLPAESWNGKFDRCAFVACANSGTELADPDNWRVMMDLYTNLAVGAMRLLTSFAPAAAAITGVLSGLLKGVAVLVKSMASAAISSKQVPGLAAMEPNGDFVKTINQTQPGQPTPEMVDYYAVLSNFKIDATNIDSIKELPEKLKMAIVDRLADSLIGENNDLVVNTASMTRIDPQEGKFISDTLDFGSNGRVYHTNYFIQEEVCDAIANWFNIADPQSLELRGIRWTEVGGTVSRAVPITVNQDVIHLDATLPALNAHNKIKKESSPIVIVRRPVAGLEVPYFYLYGRDELTKRLKTVPANISIEKALDLHEHDASPTVQLELAKSYKPTRPTIVVMKNELVGIVTPSIPTEKSQLIETATKLVSSDLTGKNILTSTMAIKPAKAKSAPPARNRRTQQSGRFIEPRIRVSKDKKISRLMPMCCIGPMLRLSDIMTEKKADKPKKARSAGFGTKNQRGGTIAFENRRMQPTSSLPTPVKYFFRADMDGEIVVNDTTSVTVEISREVLAKVKAQARVRAAGSADVDISRNLILQLVPRENIEVMGQSRCEMKPPEENKPAIAMFDVRPTAAGNCELWVVVRQGQVPLVTLELHPNAVYQRTTTGPQRTESVSTVTSELPRAEKLFNQLQIYEVFNSGQTGYRFVLQLPGIITAEDQSKPILGDRVSYINNLYREIEKRWVSSAADMNAFTRELRAMGGELYSELIPSRIQELLWKHRNEIDSIQVFSTEPFIPWELVHLKGPEGVLPKEEWFLGQMGLVRWLHNTPWPPTELRIRKGMTYAVIPCYPEGSGYELEETENEYKFLKAEFDAKRLEAHINELCEFCETPGKFDLLHFAGHGMAETTDISNAQLVLEGYVQDGKWAPEYVASRTIKECSNLSGPDSRPIVVLNACQIGRVGYALSGIGGFSAAFLKGGAGAFISSMWSVGDKPARKFTEGFYRALCSGKAMSNAVTEARKIARKDDATWLAYVVYAHPYAKLRVMK